MVMGPTHAVSGALVGLLVADVLPPEWGGPASTAETFAFAAVCAGSALLPDLDTPQSTVARSFGPVSQVAARGIDNLSLGYYTLGTAVRAAQFLACEVGTAGTAGTGGGTIYLVGAAS